jgi:rhodanese-related sulfurtransferase
VRRTERFFEHWGVRVLIVSKFVPGLSTLALPMAGASGAPLKLFLFYDTLGAALWAGVGVGLGMAFANAVGTLLGLLDTFGRGALGVLAVALAAYLGARWWRRHALLRRLRLARISVEELYRLMQGEAVPALIDVRSARHRQLDPYAIPGAHMVDAIDFDALDQRLARLPRRQKVVVYCSCPNEVSAAMLASKLLEHGFADVAPLQGGLEAWRSAGFAVTALNPNGPAAKVKAEVQTLIEKVTDKIIAAGDDDQAGGGFVGQSTLER